MKALTIWQPWASLIILGFKPYEFRGWRGHKCVVGQRIGIHAAARPVKKNELADLLAKLRSPEHWQTGLHVPAADFIEQCLETPDMLTRSAVLGTAVLGTPISADAIAHEFGGPVNDSDRDDHANFAWPMLDVQPISPPIPARGLQGFWNWNAEEATQPPTPTKGKPK